MVSLNKRFIKERHIIRSDELAIQEVVRSLQLTGCREVVEVVMGAMSLWPDTSFETPRDRANFYFSTLHALRCHVFRSYFFNGGNEIKKQREVKRDQGVPRFCTLAALLLPMRRTLGECELRSIDGAGVVKVLYAGSPSDWSNDLKAASLLTEDPALGGCVCEHCRSDIHRETQARLIPKVGVPVKASRAGRSRKRMRETRTREKERD